MYILNSAASTYVWDDVTHHDFVFHQLMSVSPYRSWAKTYTQMWQMTMRTHIPHRNSGGKILCLIVKRITVVLGEETAGSLTRADVQTVTANSLINVTIMMAGTPFLIVSRGTREIRKESKIQKLQQFEMGAEHGTK